MSKRMSRVTGVIALMLFAVASGSPVRSQDPAKPQPTPPVSAKPTQSREYNKWKIEEAFISSDHVVASCNTPQGCKALKNVCETLPKHGFGTNEDGSVGVCANTTRNSNTGAWFLKNTNNSENTSSEGRNNEAINKRSGSGQAQGKRQYGEVRITKEWDANTPALNCEGVAICRKVQSTCATLGGTYKPRNDVSGSCRH